MIKEVCRLFRNGFLWMLILPMVCVDVCMLFGFGICLVAVVQGYPVLGLTISCLGGGLFSTAAIAIFILSRRKKGARA